MACPWGYQAVQNKHYPAPFLSYQDTFFPTPSTIRKQIVYFLNIIIHIYVSALPGGDETMLHSVHIVIIQRMAISDIPVLICWLIHRRSYPTTVVWRIFGRLSPTVVDVVSRGIPHSESVNTLHFRDLTLFEGSLIKYTLSVIWLFNVQTWYKT